MRRFRATFSALLFASGAACAALPCEQAELAQYQEKAKDESGRIVLRFTYCSFESRRGYFEKLTGNDARREASTCATQQQKIIDALGAAHDTAGVQFALAGCPKQ